MAQTKTFNLKRMPGFATIAYTCIIILYLPIITLVVFSFNDGANLSNWKGFSLNWYWAAFQNELVQDASIRSLIIATFAMIISTAVATPVALATTRHRPFKGQSVVYSMINQPLMVPEIVTAISLLIVFSFVKQITGYDGLGYLILAHSAFCVPFAYLPISARLETMDLSLETVGADLYATPWQAFRRITLPLLMPGIVAGGVLAFVISLDDVVITQLVKSAGQDTLPTYMLGQIRRGVTPEMNAIATLFLALSICVVSLFFVISRRRIT